MLYDNYLIQGQQKEVIANQNMLLFKIRFHIVNLIKVLLFIEFLLITNIMKKLSTSYGQHLNIIKSNQAGEL